MGWSGDEAAAFSVKLGAYTAILEFERARIVTVKYDTYVRCSCSIPMFDTYVRYSALILT